MKETCLTIIIVEDESDHAEAMTRVFAAAAPNMELRVATTLGEYHALVADRRPDLVFMDMNLPDGNALAQLTAPAEEGPFPIVIMTSYGNEEIAVRSMKAGAIDYVVKSMEAFANMPANAVRNLREWHLLKERKRREVVVRDQEAELAAIYENAPIIMLLVDREQKLVKVNKQAVSFVGTRAMEMLGRCPGEAMGCAHAVDDPAGCGFGPYCPECPARRIVMDTFDCGTNHYQEEVELQLTIQGKRQTISVLFSTTLILLSRPLVLVTIMDVSKLKLAEELLRQQKERYQKISLENQALLDAIPDCIAMVSPEMRVVWANTACVHALRKGLDQIVGQPCFALWHGRNEVCEECPVIECFRTGSMVTQSIASSAAGVTLEVKAVPVLEGGRVVSVIEVGRDITDNLKLEERTRRNQKMEAIGVLAGGIAHDFNNILAAILGYAEMARDDAPRGSQVAQDLDKVLLSAHRAKELVKQILAFSRQATVERIPLKIQPLVKEAMKMLRASIPTTIAFEVDIDPHCPAVLADPTQVHQIIMNLGTNAYHAMEERGGVLSLTLRTTVIDESSARDAHHLGPGEYVELTVSDTGSGIGEECIGKIFDPYFTTKEIDKGTGLGLSITHGIIKSHGGAITVESVRGQGATFHVYLPVAQGEERVAPEAPEVPRGQGRILFIDDELLLAEMGQEVLQRLGYTVTTRTSSLEALSTFINDPTRFDLVITDQTMPGMTGIDLARRLLMIRPDLPIILCTGFSNLVSEESAKAIGIRAFAFKPITKAAIGQLVGKLLESRMTQ